MPTGYFIIGIIYEIPIIKGIRLNLLKNIGGYMKKITRIIWMGMV